MESKQEKVVVNEEVKLDNEEASKDPKDEQIKVLEAKLTEAINEIESIKRAAADIVNRSKQLEVDRKYASQEVVRKLLVPMSYFEGALKYQTNDEGIKNFLKGFDMIYSLILNQLVSEGLKEIDTKINDKFNPYIHEVFEVIEKEDCENDIILEIVQKGYYFKDRVIQPVKVKISKLIQEEEKQKEIN